MFLSNKNSIAFFLALSLMTRLPTPHLDNINDKDAGRSALFYPVIGLILGVLLYLPVLLFPTAPSYILSAIIICAWATITGGLHLDGLADSADGWLGGLDDKERTLKIMKDPVVGAAGAIALVCFLILKFAALTALLDNNFSNIALLIVITPIIGRAMVLGTFLTTPYVNAGMANMITTYLPKQSAGIILSLCLLCGALLNIWGLTLVLLGFYCLRRLMMNRLGGCTGDTVGATIEITEMLFMMGLALSL